METEAFQPRVGYIIAIEHTLADSDLFLMHFEKIESISTL